MTALDTLIARVEAMTGPLLYGSAIQEGTDWPALVASAFPHPLHDFKTQGALLRALCGSLDAAVAFTEALLPGWWWTVGHCDLTCHASVGPDRAHVPEPDLSKYDAGFHADQPNPCTPAIALILAALKAYREKMNG